MNISKWKKAHNKGIFTGIKMRPVNYEEIINLPVLGVSIGLPLSVLTQGCLNNDTGGVSEMTIWVCHR